MLKTSKEKRAIANDNALWVNTVSNYIIAISMVSLFGMLLFLFINFKVATSGFERPVSVKVLKEVTIELGDTAILTPSVFIENSDSIAIENVKIKSDLQKSEEYTYYDTGVVVTKGKQYLDVGTYEIELTYKEKTYTSQLIIKDSTPPTFTNYSDTVSVERDQIKTAEQLFKVRDLSAFAVSFASKNDIDFNKTGSYSTKIIAEDEYGNKTTKPLTIKVVDKNESSYSSSSPKGGMKGQTKTFATEAEVRAFGEACLKDGRAYSYHYTIQPDGSYLATFG